MHSQMMPTKYKYQAIESPTKPSGSSSAYHGPSLKLTVAAALFCLVVVFGLWQFTQTKAFHHLVEWEQSHRVVGAILFALVYAVCVIICCPSTIFDLLAGYIFGFGYGLAVAMAGKTLGSVVAFLLGRYVMQDTVRQKLHDGQPMFRAWAMLLERDELQFVVLLQFAYIPIFIKNYGLSLLNVPFGLFLWTSLLVGGTRTWLTVYIGHSATRMAQLFKSKASTPDAQSHLAQEILLVVAVVSTLLLIVVMGYRTRKYLDELAQAELDHECEHEHEHENKHVEA